jgi:hypothetical protein
LPAAGHEDTHQDTPPGADLCLDCEWLNMGYP